ncbi:biopolymer transporter ExbD [Thermostilla marina]
MKIRHTGKRLSEDLKLEMTPMIDVVFQLLTFFLMTFKIVAPEGDFFIKMPVAAPSPGVPSDVPIPPIKVRMTADSQGQLAGLYLAEAKLGSFAELQQRVRGIVGDDPGPGVLESTEVELDCDYDLRYEYVMQAITAVSGYIEGNRVVKLVEKVKFAPPHR